MTNKKKIMLSLTDKKIKLLKTWAAITGKRVSQLVEEWEVPKLVEDLINLQEK
ncbi:hypothetical protein KJ836_02720 [Patescibacteria group bacterium]|nr:hypothetical protein [Patescibacteria group bacterium]